MSGTLTLQVAARRRGQLQFAVQLLPLLLLYVGFLLLPYADLLRTSFYRYDSIALVVPVLTFANYLKALGDPFYLRIIGFTIALSAGVTVLTLALGYPVAWRIVHAGPRAKSVLVAVVLSPLLVNLVVRTYAWEVLLEDTGVLNKWLLGMGVIDHPLPLSRNLFSVVVGLTQITLPFMILSLMSIIETVRGELLEAADGLGSTPWRTFREIVWPLTLPGISAGSVLVFCYCTSAFVTPQVLGGGHVSTVSTLIYTQFSFAMNFPFGSALVFILLLINFPVIWLQHRLFA